VNFKHLLTARDGSIARLTLNRPDVRNAFNEEMIAELIDWAAGVAGDSSVRVVVIDGAGRTFCAGADVQWMAKTIHYTEPQNIADAEQTSRMFAAINSLPAPVVGRIHGGALGGGAGLAACCDIAVAADTAVFGFTEVRLGIVPAVISPFVLDKIGRAAARELFLTGTTFTAARAREIGLVQAVVPETALDVTVSEYVIRLLAGGREAIAAAKQLIAAVASTPPDRHTELTARTIAARRVSAEGQEGLRAFLEKRKPRWSQPS
jgi:methylglutaconyl-CoA hydratase